MTTCSKSYHNKMRLPWVESVATSSFGYVLEASGAANRRLMEAVFTWEKEVGQVLGELTPERRKEFLQMVVEDVVIDGKSPLREFSYKLLRTYKL